MTVALEAKEARWYVLLDAKDAIDYEAWLRAWPAVKEVRDMNDRAVREGKLFARAPENERERMFINLWWIRFNHEPVIADLLRAGLSFEEAEERMDRRLAQFRRAFYGRP